jgi:hypothetical protein
VRAVILGAVFQTCHNSIQHKGSLRLSKVTDSTYIEFKENPFNEGRVCVCVCVCVLTVCRFKVALREICSRVWFASFLKR